MHSSRVSHRSDFDLSELRPSLKNKPFRTEAFSNREVSFILRSHNGYRVYGDRLRVKFFVQEDWRACRTVLYKRRTDPEYSCNGWITFDSSCHVHQWRVQSGNGSPTLKPGF